MLKVIFNVEYKDKKSKEKWTFAWEEMFAEMNKAKSRCEEYNKLERTGPLEATYSIRAVEMMGCF